jgi:hypothetical protein
MNGARRISVEPPRGARHPARRAAQPRRAQARARQRPTARSLATAARRDVPLQERDRLVGEVGERRSSPERERVPVQGRGELMVAGARSRRRACRAGEGAPQRAPGAGAPSADRTPAPSSTTRSGPVGSADYRRERQVHGLLELRRSRPAGTVTETHVGEVVTNELREFAELPARHLHRLFGWSGRFS